MSNSINFKVSDNDNVVGFMNRLGKQATDITKKMIEDTQSLTSSSKEQLQILKERVAELQRLSRLNARVALDSVQSGTASRISNIGVRGETLDRLYDQNKREFQEQVRRFRAGEITQEELDRSRGEYQGRARRIETLAQRNTEEGITEESKERIRILREQARQDQLQADLAREQINTIERTSRDQVRQAQLSGETIIEELDDNATEQERLARNVAQEQMDEDEKRENTGHKRRSAFWDAANALAFHRLTSDLMGMPQAQDELGFARPMMGMAGGGIGALAGLPFELASIGQIEFTQIGFQLGTQLGEFMGSALERTFRGRDEMLKERYRYAATSGGFVSGVDLSMYGLDYKESASLANQMIKMKGSRVGRGELSDMAALQSGYGLDPNTLSGLYEISRTNTSGDRYIPSIVAGIKESLFGDGDRSFLSQFLTQNYAQLSKTLLTTQETVSSGTTLSILKGFDMVGGQFGIRDYRSGGLIGTIQGSLTNPGSDAAKALSFYVMRQQFPDMDMLGIQKEIQKGMGSPRYMQAMLKYIIGQGGDRSYQVNNIASYFGLENNLSAAESLYESFLGGRLPKQFRGGFVKGSMSEASVLGSDYTSKYAKSAAEIQNAFIDAATSGLDVMKDKMIDLFGDMTDEIKKYVQESVKGIGKKNPKESSRF